MEVLELKSCIVCSKPHPSFIKSELQAKLITSSLLPGSNGSVVFNNQLCMYFIAKKLLNFTDDECMRFIAHFQNNPTTGWCQVFCDKCGVYVGQALDLHKKMLMLAGKIDELAITLQSYMTSPNALSYFDEHPNSDVEDEEEEETGNEYSVGGTPAPDCISLREEDDDDLESTVSNDYELDSTALLQHSNRESTTLKNNDSPSDGSPPPALLQEEYPEVPAFTGDVPRSRRLRKTGDVDDQDGNTLRSDDEHSSSSHKGSESMDESSQGTSSTVTNSKDIKAPVLDEYADDVTPENIPDDVLEALFKMQFSDSSSDEFDGDDREWKPNRKYTKRSSKKARKPTPKKKDTSSGSGNVRKSVRKVKPSLRVRNAVADVISQEPCGSPTRRSSTAGSSTSTTTSRRHKKIHSLMQGSKGFQCEVCEQTFENFVTVSRHQRREHGKLLKLKSFKCDKCDGTYSSSKRLENHIMAYHDHVPKLSKLSCKLCGKGFMTLKELKIHARSHESKDRSEICEYCGADFLHSQSLRAHIRKFHSESTTESMNSNNNDEVVFKCKHCDFTSQLRLVIMRHRKTHAKERRFTCDLCGRGFEKPFSLKYHKQVDHEGKNPAYCEWCKKNFVNHYYLKYHHERCKKRPAEDKAKELIEKPKEKKKSSFIIVTTSDGGITTIPGDDEAESRTLTVL